MGAKRFGSDKHNGRQIPVWRLAVCRQLVVPGEMPAQVPTSPLEECLHINDQRYGSKITKGGIPYLESGICKSESIGQLNVQRNL